MGKKYACFNVEQQQYYDNLPARQQKYVYFRAIGYSKSDAFRYAGYRDTKNVAQAAYNIEKKDPKITELFKAMSKQLKLTDVYKEQTEQAKKIDEIADKEDIILPIAGIEEKAKMGALEKFNNSITEMTPDEARRYRFYRDIIQGKTKTIKITKQLDKDGNLISQKVEEINDVATRMQAQKELDRIIGIDKLQTAVGNIQAGNINIMIVDASKKDEGAPIMEMEEVKEEVIAENEQGGESKPDSIGA